MIYKLITIALLVWVSIIKAQTNNDSTQQIKNNTFLQNIKTKEDQTTFLIYNIGKEYLLITKLDFSFNFYWYKEVIDFTNQSKTYNLVRKQLNVKDKLLENLFEYECSTKNSINENEGSSYIYFRLYSNNIKKCEFVTPYLYYNKRVKDQLPIKKKYIEYLTVKLLDVY